MNPFFSIIVPTYNRANLIIRAIESALNQVFSNWELIIVDDGSTDDTRKVVEGYEDERIVYIYQTNQERSAARNNGIKSAKGTWVCFLDSDDEYFPRHLQILYDYITAKSLAPSLLVTGIEIKSSNDIKRHKFLDVNRGNILKEIWEKFILMDSVCVHSTIIKEELFDKRFRIWEDTHLWLRIASKFPVRQIEVYTCAQHIHTDSTVQQGVGRVKWEEVLQYISAINDLFDNYGSTINRYLTEEDKIKYINDKLLMYLYLARKNRQFSTSIKLWTKTMILEPSLHAFLELPKTIINLMGISTEK